MSQGSNQRSDVDGSRRAGASACVILAALIAGLLFSPVFGVAALILPLAVLGIVVFAVDLLCSRYPGLVAWRAVLVALGGLLAISETLLSSSTVAGLPTFGTVQALLAGVTNSWQLTLQSTWPARPDAALLLFVPLLMLLACVLGLELLHRLRGPLPALLPSLAVAVLSQFFATMPALPATIAALAFAAVLGGLLALSRQQGGTPDPTVARRFRVRPALASAGPPVLAAVLVAVLAVATLPGLTPRYTVARNQLAPLVQASVNSPLNEIGYRLHTPDTPVFTVRGAAGVDRWPLVVLTRFDGVDWTPGSRYRRLGADVRPDPEWTVPVVRRSATVSPLGLTGPWLPSQTSPAGVRGAAPLVEQQQGTLLQPDGNLPRQYTLDWWEPQIDPGTLGSAGVASDAPGGLDGLAAASDRLQTLIARIGKLADTAVHGLNTTFRTAVVLERFMREHYRTATGANLPTGHGWAQLGEFLLRSKRGTSEQFATAYAVLARMRGIPVRVVVGYRAPRSGLLSGDYTVHNSDVLAWPEVAVEHVGWVPLDPGGVRSAGGTAGTGGLAAATAKVRDSLPPTGELTNPPVAPPHRDDAAAATGGFSVHLPLRAVGGVLAVLLLAWLLGVPGFAALRAYRRRRRPGMGAVLGACEEVRDRLRAHGLRLSPGMTLRDLAGATGAIADQATVDGVRDLGRTADWVLYSGVETPGEAGGKRAWAAVRTVRKGLARRGVKARLRATFTPRARRP